MTTQQHHTPYPQIAMITNNTTSISPIKRLIFSCILLGLGLLTVGGMHPARVKAAPQLQGSCTLPATVTTADQLYDCITVANAGSGGTITLGADIDLTTLTTSPLPNIASTIVLEGAGYAIDGGWDGVVGSTVGVGIFTVVQNGDLTVNQATLQNGNGTPSGGIYNLGSLTVTNSTFHNNLGTGGGAIHNYYDNLSGFGTATVSNSTFSGNNGGSAGGAINNTGAQGRVTVTNSTFSANSATHGGAIYINAGQVTATNNTFSGNSASNLGDATYSIGVGWRLYLAGNIFAGSASGDNCRAQGSSAGNEPIDDNGYNLSDDITCTNGGTGSATNATLPLGALADNGGSTQTHLPGAGSDAIEIIPNGATISNNGTNWTCNQSSTDQRGELRPLNSGNGCTAGAVEVAPPCSSWTVTTADELYQCVLKANGNESPSPTADTITLGADIDLTTLTTSPLPQITSEITVEGAGYVIDGGNTVQLFNVGGAGDLTVNQATLSNGNAFNGGAIYNDGTLMLTNSTLTGNTATNGGALFNAAISTITALNNTFSGNTATNSGGVIYSVSTLASTNNTFANNNATNGTHLYSFSTMHLAGNIFATGSGGANCFSGATLNDNGYNLSDDTSCTNGGSGSATNATLNLGGLANNGGATQTHLPGAGSDAIGAIPNGTTISNNGISWSCNDVDTFTDQRGESRPINSGDACTVGAVEVTPICTSWTVTTAVELSECITLANTNESPSPTGDTITLGADIMLSTALPQITSEITLEGAGYTVDGGNTVRLFNVGAAGNFTVNQATLQNGFSATDGGGVNNRGTLMVTNSTFSGNLATDDGGGIYNFFGAVTITNSTFSGNRTTGVTSNGGAVYNSGGVVTVTKSTFFNNTTQHRGGGIYLIGGNVTVTNSTFSGNRATGVASNGGAVYSSGTLIVTNSTFSGNSAIGSGGGIYFTGAVHLAGTIFAQGANGVNCVNSTGTLIDNGYNLSGDSTCINGGPGSATNATLNLGALADNGGSTQTHALLSGSDAIDAIPYGTSINNNGVSWTCNALNTFTDQRGVARPQGIDCDSGAYEVEPTQTGPNFVVNTNADTDDGACDLLGQGIGNQDCTLREAINAANADVDASTITFAADYTITLTSQLPNVTTETTISGVGRSITVDGDNNSYQMFTVGGALTINSLTLANGLDMIVNGGDLTVLNSTLRDGAGDVGGIYSNTSGQLIVANSTFYNNQGANTGAIQVDSGTAVINNVTISGSSGTLAGGIYTYFTPATITNSIITNSSGGDCVTDGGSFSGSNNLIGDHAAGACAAISSAAVTNLAASPADNGGDTHTIALLVGSNALDAGNNASCEATDQRGVSRPFSGSCDIGAFEAKLYCAMSDNTAYTFTDLTIFIEPGGLGDMVCLEATYMSGNHPAATGGLQTGFYWMIEAFNSSLTPASGFMTTMTMTVPFIPDATDKLCRYTGSTWDCVANGFDAGNQTITRNAVTQFSPWTAGNDVGPTAVTLHTITISAPDQSWILLLVLLLGLATAVVTWRHLAKQHSCKSENITTILTTEIYHSTRANALNKTHIKIQETHPMKSQRLLWPVSLFLFVVLLLTSVVSQAQAQAVNGSITIVKDADPADGTDFSFATTPGLAEPSYLLQWGSFGSGNGQFAQPYGVAVDDAGNVYVVDSFNHRVQKFDSSGAYLTQWGSNGSGDGQFAFPFGVAVDGAGNVYVADRDNHRIQKFDSSGAYLTQWGSLGTGNGQFDTPIGMAVDGTGNIYVADRGNNRIQKFDSSGSYLTHWGSNGSGNGQFNGPYGVALDGAGNVYVADYNNHRIQKFDSSGNYLAQWGSSGGGTGQFNRPYGVAVDGLENVYVTDSFNHRIQKFDSNGAYLTQWGSNGSGAGQFDYATGVAVDGAGYVYVADLFNHRIQKFSTSHFTLDDAVPDDSDGISETVTFPGLSAGSYSFTETLPLDWHLVVVGCDSGSWTADLPNAALTVNLSAGQNITCTFSNVEPTQTGPNFVVNTNADTDDGFCDLLGQGFGNQDCTLREAINAANDNADASTITFAADYTITLTAPLFAPLPNLNTEITISGVGRSVTVDGNNNSYQIFIVGSSGPVTIDSLTLANGLDAIGNSGDLTVLNSTFRDGGGGDVGGIYSNGSQLIVVNSTFYNNQGANAGAIQVDGGTVVINNVTLSGNSGTLAGGIYTYFTTATVTNSIITDSTGGDCGTDNGSFSGGNNLIDDHAAGACAGISSAAVTNLAASPADNGGDTHTIALLNSSNAINRGNNASCEATDQRGETRPQGMQCDIGAFELVYTGYQNGPNFIVNTDADTDDGSCDLPGQGIGNQDCTLREAINAANFDADTSIITFGGDYTITLTATLPGITTEMTIDGSGHSIAVSGAGTYRVFTVSSAGNLTVNTLTIANGSAQPGGGIRNNGTLTVTNSTLSNNSATFNGGGIFNQGTAMVTDSTLSGNSAGYGGGIYNSVGDLTVTNSTFSGNTSTANGGAGGTFNGGIATVTNSTFSGNLAADPSGANAIINGIGGTGATIYLAGNIFDSDASANNCRNYETLIDNGYNLSSDTTCTDGGTGSMVNATLNLEPLADNGGPTWAHALLSGSDAINVIPYGTVISNNGVTWTCNDTDPFTDQRGVTRPQGIGCDSGAYEAEFFALTVALAGNGAGSVSGPGIACAGDCTEAYLETTVVTLTASADTGSTFTGWAGDCTGTGDCVMTMDAAQNVTATFTLDVHLLTVNLAGTGSGTVSGPGINCGVDCDELFAYGTVVTLTASADTGSIFTGWSGACLGTGDCVVTMDAAQTVTATMNVEPTQTGPNFVVNSSADTDDGACDLLGQGTGNLDCTLREAINAANFDADASIITFTGNYTITLDGSQLPAITTEMTITGNGPANTIIQASTCDPTDSGSTCTHDYRVFEVGTAGNVTLENVTVQHGFCVGGCATDSTRGGGIYNGGTLVVNNSHIIKNKANAGGGIAADSAGQSTVIAASHVSYNHVGGGDGGGITAYHPVTITNSSINYNQKFTTIGDGGGGIYVDDVPFLLENSDVIGNTSERYGGGVLFYYGSGTIRNSRIFSNTAASSGGGIYIDEGGSYGGTIIENSEIAYNSANQDGGGMVVYNGPEIMVTNSIFHHNEAQDYGGGISFDDGSPTGAITGTIFADNTAQNGGGLNNNGNLSSLVLESNTFENNAAIGGDGGAIYSEGYSSGAIHITNSAFYSNTADGYGGGIISIAPPGVCADEATTTIANSTFSGNSAASAGGGIYNQHGVTDLRYNTITANTGGGVHSYNDADTCTKAGGNIIFGNTGHDVSAVTTIQRFDSYGYNLVGVAGANVDFSQEFNATGDLTPANGSYNPVLGPLADNGGSTYTHALLAGSDAIDAGDTAVCAAVPVNNLDQRGVTRPQGSICDIGAFEAQAFTLTVALAGSGVGSVSGPGIACAGDCTEAYVETTVVTLTASADTNSTFTGWTGACTGTGDCVVTMDAAKNVTATFALEMYLLTVNLAGTGSGTVSGLGINCGVDCDELFDYGTVVTLTASADTGSTFAGWSGDCTGTGDCVVTMDAAKNVTATFALDMYLLTVNLAGTGSGTVSGPGINCGVDCDELFDYGTIVTLTAAADTGTTFTGWSGACSGTGDCVVTMDEAKEVTAVFDQNTTPTSYQLFLPFVTKP